MDAASLSDIRKTVIANKAARAHYNRKGESLLARHCDQRIDAAKDALNRLMEGVTAEEALSPEYAAITDVYLLTLDD